MYDFYFGENSHVEQNEETFLISIKRMLPMDDLDSRFRVSDTTPSDKEILSGKNRARRNDFKLPVKDVNLHRSFVNSISLRTHGLKTPVDFFFHDSHVVLDTIAPEINDNTGQDKGWHQQHGRHKLLFS